MVKKVLVCIITAVGLTSLFWIASLFIEAKQALHWPQAKAKILSAELVIDHLPSYLDFSTKPVRWYGVNVRYQYSVKDWIYISNRITVHDIEDRNPKNVFKILNKYRKLRETAVYYDPADPRRALLEPGEIGDVYFPLMMGGLLALVGLVFLYEMMMEFKPSPQIDHLYWGNFYQKKGQYAQALYEFNQMVQINPYLAEGYKRRALFFVAIEEWDRAIEDFNEAIRINPTDASVFLNRAQAFLAKGLQDRASMDLDKAMNLGLKIKPEVLAKFKKPA